MVGNIKKALECTGVYTKHPKCVIKTNFIQNWGGVAEITKIIHGFNHDRFMTIMNTLKKQEVKLPALPLVSTSFIDSPFHIDPQENVNEEEEGDDEGHGL